MKEACDNLSDNIARYPSKFTKAEVRQEFGADGNDQRSIWNYGDYYIWFLHLARQKPSGGWESTANNGRVNIWYQDKDNALIIEMLNGYEHKPAGTKQLLVFASHDENNVYEFKGVFENVEDTTDGVIDHICKRVSKGFDIDEMKPI